MLKTRTDGKTDKIFLMNLEWSNLKAFSPETHSLLEIKNKADMYLVRKMFRHPLIFQNASWLGKIFFHREFHMRDDHPYFLSVPSPDAYILYEGKMIEQYNPYFSKPRYYFSIKEGIEQLYKSPKKCDVNEYRIGYRNVASSTNRRCMISCIIPKNVFSGNSMNVSRIYADNKRIIENDKLIYITTVFNSFWFDYLMRLRVNTDLNLVQILQLPFPKPKVVQTDQIIDNALNLTENWPDFKELRTEFGVKGHALENNERIELIALNNVIVAQLYDLKEKECRYILNTFHSTKPEEEAKLEIVKKSILSKI